MAGRGVKRSAPQGGAEVKMLDISSHDSMVSLVTNAIDKAIELDESSRVMLRSMAPLCFHTPSHERHEYQVAVGEMLQQALEKAEAAVSVAIKDAEEEVEVRAAGKVVRLKEDLKSRRGRLATELKALEEAKEAWCEVHVALRVDWRTLVAVQEERQRVDANLFEAVGKKAALEAAIESHFGAVVGGQEIGPNIDALVQACLRAGMDAGLVNSFDLVARKRPEARTSFEKVVLDELRQTAVTRAKTLAAIAERGNPGSAERMMAEVAARAAFVVTERRMAEAARHLRNAEVNVQVAQSDVVDAEDAFEIADHEKRRKAVDHVMAQRSLEQLQLGPLTAFKKLHEAALGTVATSGA